MKQLVISIIILLIAISLKAQNDSLSNSINEYSFDLYKQIKTDEANLFISPLSTYYALMLAYEGAKNDTKEVFERVLKIKDTSLLENFIEFTKNLLTSKNPENSIKISNALWIKDGLNIKKVYKNKIETRYLSEINQVDFNKNNEVANEINEWVSKNTNGLIKNIINGSSINEYTRLIITNAIYFYGRWENEFRRQFTEPDDFNSIDGDDKEIDFMNGTQNVNYYENKYLQFIAKSYIGHDKSFCIILPKKRYNLNDFEKILKVPLLNSIINDSKFELVELSIPKFKLEKYYTLDEPLSQLGLKKVFSQQADLSGISTDEPLMVNSLCHKTFFEIDEVKTEAAAATVMPLCPGASDDYEEPETKVFKADRPFIFMILDNRTKCILFLGRFVKPE